MRRLYLYDNNRKGRGWDQLNGQHPFRTYAIRITRVHRFATIQCNTAWPRRRYSRDGPGEGRRRWPRGERRGGGE